MNNPKVCDSGADVEEEKTVLGLSLISGIVPDLKITDFSTPYNRQVFDAICKESKEIVPNIVNVTARLRSENCDNALISYVIKLTDIPIPGNKANLEYHSSKVLENSRIRQSKEILAKVLGNEVALDDGFEKINELFNSFKKPNQMNKFYSAYELAKAQYLENEWIADNFISTGLTVISGTQKIGKSWLGLNLGLAVASGGYFLGKIKTNKTGVLYLSLEDPNKRLTKRLNKVTQGNVSLLDNIPLNITNKFVGHIKALRDYLEQHKETRLIVVDTLVKFIQTASKEVVKDFGDYGQTTKALTALKDIADDFNIAIVVIHHARKGSNKATETDDVFDESLGSTGIYSTADTIMLFRKKVRTESEAELSITGRDIEDMNYILGFDKNIGCWSLIGDKAEIQATEARQEIFDYLKEHPEQTPRQIFQGMQEQGHGTKRSESTLKKILAKMIKDNVLTNNKGFYSVKGYTLCTPYTAESAQGIPECTLSNEAKAEKTPENEAKEVILNAGSFDKEIANAILKYLENNRDRDSDIAALTEFINGDSKDIVSTVNTLFDQGYIRKFGDYFKPITELAKEPVKQGDSRHEWTI